MRTHIRYPGAALFLWASCSSLPPVAASPPGAPACPDHGKSAPASPVLESLECRNDYLTHIRCSWMEVPGVPLSLLYQDRVDGRTLPCVSCTPQSRDAVERTRACCQFNKSRFIIGSRDVFFFDTPHLPGLSKIVYLTQHARRQHPCDLATNITSEGGWTQDWLELRPSSSPVTHDSLTSAPTSEPKDLHQTADAGLPGRPVREGLQDNREVMTEKRRGGEKDVKERGEEGCGEGSGERRGEGSGQWLEEAGLLPSSDLQHAGAQSLWSEWSPLVAGLTSSDGQPGPFDLQCVYDQESEVRCSWKMMRELSQYILYSLSYRTKPHAPSKRCCAVLDDEDDEDDVVRFSCSFSVSAAEVLLVHLSPEPRTKVIQSHKHIEPLSPVGLHVALMGGDWVLNWTLPKYRTVPISSELRYGSTHLPEVTETLLLPAGVSVYALPERSLQGAVRYLVQVRSVVTPRKGTGARYAGHPSPWSQPVQWTTRPAPDSSHVYFLMAASVSASLILIYFTLLAFQRRVRVWEVSLPSPFQSKVLEAVCQSHGERLPSHTEVDDPHISEAYVLGRLELTTDMPTSDWEYNDITMPPGVHSNETYQYASQEECCMTKLDSQTAEMWHFSIPSHAFQGGSSVHESIMGVEVFMSNGRFMCLASNSQNALQPCSDGYQLSPLASDNITQDALLNVGLDDVEMYDAYMDCPK